MAVRYQILRMETIGTPPVKDGGVPITFTDPVEASRQAKMFSTAYREKMCVKPVVNDEWREREEARFDDGTYRHLPWRGNGWWMSDRSYAIWKDHYPHASMEKPGWIAFTKTAEDGAKDKQTLVRPGAYLNRFFEAAMADYGVRERRLVEDFMKMYGPIDIKFATTEQDVIRVYNGLHTCMTGKCWPMDIHPATTYLAGDLQVAYLGDLDAGKVSARCVVWPERKLHSRVYGDIARLTQGLQRLDYKWGAPIGARIKRIQLKAPRFVNGRNISQCFLVPYIDKKNQAGGGHLSVKDAGDHLVICEEGDLGSHHAGQADGTSGLYVRREDEVPTFTCDKCGTAKLRNVHQVFTCIADEGEDEPEDEIDVSWCTKCAANYSYSCGYSGKRFTYDVDSVTVGGMTWATYYADMYADRCEGNGNLYTEIYLIDLWTSQKEHKKYSTEYINDQYDGDVYRSGLTDHYILKEDIAKYYGRYMEGNYCAKWELKNRTFQCDGCDINVVLEDRHQHFGDDRLFCQNCVGRIVMGRPAPVSKSRKEFENARDQHRLPLIAAE